MAMEYTQRLKDVESATKWVDNFEKSMGYTAICRHGYVDENGNFSSFAVVVRKDALNEKLRKEAQENAEKQIEKSKEKATEKREELQEVLEENTPSEKVEQMVLEKLENPGNGEIYLDDDDMQMILDAAKEETQI